MIERFKKQESRERERFSGSLLEERLQWLLADSWCSCLSQIARGCIWSVKKIRDDDDLDKLNSRR